MLCTCGRYPTGNGWPIISTGCSGGTAPSTVSPWIAAREPPLKLPLDAELGPFVTPRDFGHRRVRYIYPEHICLCDQNVPCFDFGKLLRGNLNWAMCTMPQHLDDGLPVPNVRATLDLVQDMLPGSHLVGDGVYGMQQVGPIVS